MSLLREIQASLMEQDQQIGPILLKLRFLASRLGSNPLEEWVSFETEGYPKDADLPEYRLLDVAYHVDTVGFAGSGIRNAPVPPALISQHAGDLWVNYHCRQSVASIDSLISGADGNGSLSIDASNLIILLQGKIYPNDTIVSVSGTLSLSALVEIQTAVRARVLELTIELEKEMPFAADIVLGPAKVQVGTEEQQKVSQITHQVINGNYTSIANSSVISGSVLSITPNDQGSVISALVGEGVSEVEAQEFAKILSEETPESSAEPFGAKAKEWVAEKAGKMASGAWNIGVAAGTKVLTEAALKYYGLK